MLVLNEIQRIADSWRTYGYKWAPSDCMGLKEVFVYTCNVRES
jgi:hypothetical protein